MSSEHATSSESNTLDLPVIDLAAYFNREADPAAYETECRRAAEAFREHGALAVRDPRVFPEDNERFLDMMERYFGLSDGVRDARPDLHYQVGVTPNNVERAVKHCKRVGAYGPDDKPLTLCPPDYDPKWRFFWRIGPQPENTHFPALNADPVVPPEIPEWAEIMDMWGNKMHTAVFTLAELCAVGFGLEAEAFTSLMRNGPHLLAPTGSDFSKYGTLGTVLAGFHYDLNFMTIHGKSRFPGLYVWTRTGHKKAVRIPDGCLLVQAGKQFEFLTGGYVEAGFHEVVVAPNTVEAIERARANHKSLWRVSSTLFAHIQSDQSLAPIGKFSTEESRAKYPAIPAGQQVQEELNAIKLKKDDAK